MTVASTTNRVDYTGNGSTTVFSFTFRIFANSDLVVTTADDNGVETTLVLDTDYTVTGAGSYAGGSITISPALASGTALTIQRVLDITQETDLRNQGQFFAETHEDVFDRMVMIGQQLQEQIDRSAKLPVTNTTDADALAADIVLLADNITMLDTIADAITDIQTVANDLNEATSEIEVVAGAITNVNAVGDNMTNVNTVAGIASNVTSVAGNATNINAVAGNATNINAVNANKTNIDAVAGNSTNINAVNSNKTNIDTAASNIAAIIAAPTEAANAASSATAASNSAALAAAAAASGMYSAVQDKSADYTVVSGDAGDLIRVTTTGGARTITLPAISSVSDGFKVAIVKWTGDTNAVTVARSGSDTINGASSATIDSQYTQIVFVADFETNQWLAVTSGLGSTNVVVDVFSGNGSTTAFTLSGDAGSKNNTYVFVGGVYQQKSTYSWSGTTLTFSSAPPSGTSNIEVVWTQPLAIGTPSDGTVTPAKMSTGGPTWDSSGNLKPVGSLQQIKAAISASAIDLSLGNYFTKTIASTTTFTVSNTPSTGVAASFILDLTNGGSQTINWWSGVKWAGGTAPTLTASGRDVLGFFTHDGGTTWSGLLLGKDVK